MERRTPFLQNVKLGGPYTIHDIKVMLCYILNTLNKPISAEDLLNITQTEELVNYFEYESAMGELLDAGQIEKFTDQTGEDFYKISELGASLVVDLEASLAIALKARAIRAALKVLTFKQNKSENKVEIKESEKGGYILSFEIPGEPEPLCKAELYFPERLQAEMAKDGFLTNPALAYTALLSALTGDRSTLLAALDD